MLLALLGLATAASAAVYQCKGADGSTVFSDSPCGADATVVVVRPQERISTPAPANVRAQTLARSQSELDQTRASLALQCQARDFRAWYDAQNPKPDREQSDARMRQIVQACWTSTHLTAAAPATSTQVVQVVRHAPQAQVGGAAGSPGGPVAINGTLQVSRARDPAEATRWSNYFDCKSQAFQDWTDHLGHTATDAETRSALSRADSTCRQKFSLPAGVTAIVVD